MSKALAVLKLFFSLVSINSTETPPITDISNTNSTLPITQVPQLPAPLLLKPMDQLAAFIGQAFHYQIPDDTFYPTYSGQTPVNALQLSMLTKHGGKISPNSWIRFEPKTRDVYGFPLPGNKGVFRFLILATNEVGKSARDTLKIDVGENEGQYNHEFALKVNFNLVNFMADILVRFDFISRVARYCAKGDASGVWLKSFDETRKEIKITFNTMAYSPCNKGKLQRIMNKLTTTSGGVSRGFQNALSNKFPISGVQLNLLGPCSPKKKPKGDPFDWGWLKHILPVLMLMGVVGIPVVISVLVHKHIAKKRAKARGQMRRRRKEEDGMNFTFHTVHFNNRYPSMLSVSNNSKEDDGTDDEKSNANTKAANIPNGSPPAMKFTVPNSNPKRQSNNLLNPDTGSNTAGQNSDKPKNTSKSKTIYMGKSNMNIPTYFTQPAQVEETSERTFSNLAESLSTKLKGIGKSMLNVAGQGEGDSETIPPTDGAKQNGDATVAESGANAALVESENQIYVPGLPKSSDVTDVQAAGLIDVRRGKITKRSQSELRLSDHSPKESMGNFHEFGEAPNITGTLMSPSNSHLPQRRMSLPQICIESVGHSSFDLNGSRHGIQIGSDVDERTNKGSISKKCSLRRKSTSQMANTAGSGEVYSSQGTVIEEYTQYIDKLSREAREDFGDAETLYEDEYHLQEDHRDITEYPRGHEDRRRIHSLPTDCFTSERGYSERRETRSDGYEYPEDYNDTSTQRIMTETDEEEEQITIEDQEAMDYTTWRLRQIRRAERAAKKASRSSMSSHGGQEVGFTENGVNHSNPKPEPEYQEYTNPYQYSNGPVRSPIRSQSSYGGFGSDRSSAEFSWMEDYEKENRYKQQSPDSENYSYLTQSMSSGLDRRRKYSQAMMGNHIDSRYDNRDSAHGDRTLLGSIFSRDKPANDKNANQAPEGEDSSLVGFIKTRVTGLLGPSEGPAASRWFK